MTMDGKNWSEKVSLELLNKLKQTLILLCVTIFFLNLVLKLTKIEEKLKIRTDILEGISKICCLYYLVQTINSFMSWNSFNIDYFRLITSTNIGQLIVRKYRLLPTHQKNFILFTKLIFHIKFLFCSLETNKRNFPFSHSQRLFKPENK